MYSRLRVQLSACAVATAADRSTVASKRVRITRMRSLLAARACRGWRDIARGEGRKRDLLAVDGRQQNVVGRCEAVGRGGATVPAQRARMREGAAAERGAQGLVLGELCNRAGDRLGCRCDQEPAAAGGDRLGDAADVAAEARQVAGAGL